MIPAPDRVEASDYRWFVWFAVPDGAGRRLKLVMVPRG